MALEKLPGIDPAIEDKDVWEGVVPEGEPYLEGGSIIMNPKYAKLVCSIFEGMVLMEFHGDSRPIKVTSGREEDEKAFALIMPGIK